MTFAWPYLCNSTRPTEHTAAHQPCQLVLVSSGLLCVPTFYTGRTGSQPSQELDTNVDRHLGGSGAENPKRSWLTSPIRFTLEVESESFLAMARQRESASDRTLIEISNYRN